MKTMKRAGQTGAHSQDFPSRPMYLNGQRPLNLTQDLIKLRMDNIKNHSCEFDRDTFNFGEDDNSKTRLYYYFRKCVYDYRNKEPHEELTLVLAFLKANNGNKTWVAKTLMDKAVKVDNEYWGSGSHEWLERSFITEVLERSAGMTRGVEPYYEIGCIWGEIDWLMIHANCRTATKYIFFKSELTNSKENSTIYSGHPGAVKRNLNPRSGFAQEGSGFFHQDLEYAFNHSKTCLQFIKSCIEVYEYWLISGEKEIIASQHQRYVFDGTSTNDPLQISQFRAKIQTAFEEMQLMFENHYDMLSRRGDDDNVLTAKDGHTVFSSLFCYISQNNITEFKFLLCEKYRIKFDIKSTFNNLGRNLLHQAIVEDKESFADLVVGYDDEILFTKSADGKSTSDLAREYKRQWFLDEYYDDKATLPKEKSIAPLPVDFSNTMANLITHMHDDLKEQFEVILVNAINQGYNINEIEVTSGKTLLSLAINSNYKKMAEILVMNGASLAQALIGNESIISDIAQRAWITRMNEKSELREVCNALHLPAKLGGMAFNR